MAIISAKRESRIDIRASAPVKQLLQKAASISHKKVTEFLLEAGINAANHTLADQLRFEVSEMEWQAFHAALDAPTTAKPKLKDLLLKPGILDR